MLRDDLASLVQQMIDRGILFEDAFYPGQKHAFGRAATRHWYARMTEFFERELLPATRP